MSASKYRCCQCCEGIALDDHVGHGGSVEKDGHDTYCADCRETWKPIPAEAAVHETGSAG